MSSVRVVEYDGKPADDRRVAACCWPRRIRAERRDAGRIRRSGSGIGHHGAPGNTGLAHGPRSPVGASTDLMDQAWWSPGLTHPDGSAAFALWFTGGIFVDKDGRRFVNESAAYDRLGREIIRRDARRAPSAAVLDDLRQPGR